MLCVQDATDLSDTFSGFITLDCSCMYHWYLEVIRKRGLLITQRRKKTQVIHNHAIILGLFKTSFSASLFSLGNQLPCMHVDPRREQEHSCMQLKAGIAA